jgi:alkaline phosphatase
VSLFSATVSAQPKKYTTANAHAHNDYEHPVPFYSAYNAGFGSIEADVFLVDDQLYVAHNKKDIDTARSLQSLYLKPLQKQIKKNKGYVYADHSKKLILLVDLKTEAEPTLQALIKLLQHYKVLTGCRSLKIVITGNQPDVSRLTDYPPFVFFDGRLNTNYTLDELKRITLFSDNFRNYSSWNGENNPDKADREKIESAITKAHAFRKPIRFWAAPDSPNAWQEFMRLKVDFINTDKIEEISNFLRSK